MPFSAACRVTWGDPFAGQGADTFELSPDSHTFTLHSDMTSAATGQRVQYKCVMPLRLQRACRPMLRLWLGGEAAWARL